MEARLEQPAAADRRPWPYHDFWGKHGPVNVLLTSMDRGWSGLSAQLCSVSNPSWALTTCKAPRPSPDASPPSPLRPSLSRVARSLHRARMLARLGTHIQSRPAADALWPHVSGATRIGRKFRYGADWLWLAPSDAKLVMRCSGRLQFTVEQIPYLWPMHGIVVPVSDTSGFAFDRISFPHPGQRRRGVVLDMVMLAFNWIYPIKYISATDALTIVKDVTDQRQIVVSEFSRAVCRPRVQRVGR